MNMHEADRKAFQMMAAKCDLEVGDIVKVAHSDIVGVVTEIITENIYGTLVGILEDESGKNSWFKPSDLEWHDEYS